MLKKNNEQLSEVISELCYTLQEVNVRDAIVATTCVLATLLQATDDPEESLKMVEGAIAALLNEKNQEELLN